MSFSVWAGKRGGCPVSQVRLVRIVRVVRGPEENGAYESYESYGPEKQSMGTGGCTVT